MVSPADGLNERKCCVSDTLFEREAEAVRSQAVCVSEFVSVADSVRDLSGAVRVGEDE